MNLVNKRSKICIEISVLLSIFCLGIISNPHVMVINNNISQIQNPKTSSSINSDPIGDEWTMFRGMLNHTGVTNTTPVGNNGIIWSKSTGGRILSSPAVANGMVYVGSEDNKLYCFNSITGDLAWNYTTGGSIDSSPALTNGNVYFGSNDKNIYCLNAVSGDKNWSYPSTAAMSSSPIVYNDKVYAYFRDGSQYVINASDGTEISGFGANPLISTIVIGSPSISNNLICETQENLFECKNLINGSYFLYYPNLVFISSPAISNDKIYFGGDDKDIYCLSTTSNGQPYAPNETIIWNYKTGGAVESSPAISNGMVYIGSNDSKIYCLNANDGTSIWNYTTGGSVYSSPAISNGMLYCGSDDGSFYCLNATNGDYIWSISTGSPIDSSPAIANGRVYFGNNAGNFYCAPMIYPPQDKPSNFNAASGYCSVTLTWSAPASNGGSQITEYKIYRGSSSGSESLLTAVPGNIYTYLDSGLNIGTHYYYKIIAVNMVGEGPESSEMSATPLDKSTAPQNLQLIPGNEQVFLSWQAPSSNGGSAITEYNIYRGTSSGNLTLIRTIGNFLSYTDTGLTNGRIYYYKVSAITAAGEGQNSTENSTISVTMPSAPQNLQLSALNNQVMLLWQVPLSNGGSNITGYSIYRGINSGYELLINTIGNILNYTDTGLAYGQTYYYTVSAINSIGTGNQSNEMKITLGIKTPDAPQYLQSRTLNGQIILSWHAPLSNGGSNITEYKIYRGTSPNNLMLIKTVGNVLTYIDTGLTNGNTYYYTVCAVNSAGTGNQSNKVTVTLTSNSLKVNSVGGMQISILLAMSTIGIIFVLIRKRKFVK